MRESRRRLGSGMSIGGGRKGFWMGRSDGLDQNECAEFLSRKVVRTVYARSSDENPYTRQLWLSARDSMLQNPRVVECGIEETMTRRRCARVVREGRHSGAERGHGRDIRAA